MKLNLKPDIGVIKDQILLHALTFGYDFGQVLVAGATVDRRCGRGPLIGNGSVLRITCLLVWPKQHDNFSQSTLLHSAPREPATGLLHFMQNRTLFFQQ